MKTLLPIITLCFLVFAACEDEPLVVYPELITISCQEDADAAKQLIGDAIFDADDPEAGFRGNIEIKNATGGCSPVTDLSLFENYKFWLGSIDIESDAITDLSFLNTVEQIQGGLSIRNCSNLDNIVLPNTAFISDYFVLDNNSNLQSIEIGTELTDTYDKISFDSIHFTNNTNLVEWKPGKYDIDFIKGAIITGNEQFTSWLALESLSLPSNYMELELYGVTVDDDNINTDLDSLILPKRTIINALAPDNDYSWLSKAKERFRFDDEGVKIDSVIQFVIQGNVSVAEVCSLKGVITETPLEIISTQNGSMMITEQTLMDECP